MINLIPNQEKKKKIKDFYFRLLVVFLFAIGCCALAAVVSILPTYFLTSIEKNLAHAKLEAQQNETETPAGQSLNLAVAGLNSKLAIIEAGEKGAYLVSQKIIQEITLRKTPDIRITRIMYESDPAKGKKITVRGVAPSRERLLLFRRALEEDTYFQEVDLPISNFVKGSDIEFSLSLIPS